MSKRIVISKGKKYIVTVPSWSDYYAGGVDDYGVYSDVSGSVTSSLDSFRLTEDGSTRITEEGEFRIIE